MAKDNNTVAHEWAAGRVAKGSNLFSEYDGYGGIKIYSYGHHYVAAYRYGVGDTSVVFMNDDSYSPSTQRHLSHIYGACWNQNVFHVKDPDALQFDSSLYYGNKLSKAERTHRRVLHKKNYEGMLEKAKECHIDACKRRNGSGIQATMLHDANHWVSEANRYSNFFKLGYKDKPDYELDPNMKEKLDKARKLELARQKRAAAKREREAREKLKSWLNGEDVSLYGVPRTQRPYIRVIQKNIRVQVTGQPPELVERFVIETSWGVRDIPYDVVKAVIPWAERCVEEGVSMTMTDEIDKINRAMQVYAREQGVNFGWRLDEITHKGVIRFGCHAIPLKAAKAIQTTVKEARQEVDHG